MSSSPGKRKRLLDHPSRFDFRMSEPVEPDLTACSRISGENETGWIHRKTPHRRIFIDSHKPGPGLARIRGRPPLQPNEIFRHHFVTDIRMRIGRIDSQGQTREDFPKPGMESGPYPGNRNGPFPVIADKTNLRRPVSGFTPPGAALPALSRVPSRRRRVPGRCATRTTPSAARGPGLKERWAHNHAGGSSRTM